jgi:FtsP/CotA-like multicopper oxidase with cupredoxin domain
MKNIPTVIAITILICAGVYGVTTAILSYLPKPPAQKTQLVSLENVTSYDLTANYVSTIIDGKNHTMLAYNGNIPGPTLSLEQGSPITLKFINESGGEQSLLFSNSPATPEPKQIAASTFEEIEFKATTPGVYWYFAGPDEAHSAQMGLYGAILVRSRSQKIPDNEEVLVLSNVEMKSNKIKRTLPTPLDPNEKPVYIGNTPLLNSSTNYQLSIPQESVTRLYIANASDTQKISLVIDSHMFRQTTPDKKKKFPEFKEISLEPRESKTFDLVTKAPGTFAITATSDQISKVVGSLIVTEKTK